MTWCRRGRDEKGCFMRSLRPCYVHGLLNSSSISLMLCLVYGLSPVAYFKGGGSHVKFSRLNESTCHKICKDWKDAVRT